MTILAMAARSIRILLAHNYYRTTAPSGENTVFENEWTLLENSGATVIPFIRRNDDLDDTSMSARLKIGIQTSWSNVTYRAMQALLRESKPDVAHFHNTFPQISPSAYLACQEAGVPVVQTLHNFRLICVGALLQRDERPCEACVGRSEVLGLWPGLRHRCYRGSLVATSAVTLMLARNRLNGSYRYRVNRYIALTRFAAGRLQAGGLPAGRITVKPNFLPNPPAPGRGDGGFVVFVGRLSAEKGLMTLLNAWKTPGLPPLRIIGDGPLRNAATRLIAEHQLPVDILGYLPRPLVHDHVRAAVAQIVPSEWYEGFPMVVLDAMACGTPVIASRIGGLDELIGDGQTGFKFEPGNATALAGLVKHVVRDLSGLQQIRSATRRHFEENYTAERNLHQLLEIYASARR